MDVTQEEEIKTLFDFDINIPGRHSCWQQLRLKNLEASPSTFKVIDEAGIVLALQADLVNGLAREIARQVPMVLQKAFQISQTFQVPTTDFDSATKYKMGYGPRSRYEASLCIVWRLKADELRNQT